MLLVYSHAFLKTSLEVKGCRDCSSLPAYPSWWSSNQELPVLHLGSRPSPSMSWGFVGLPSPTAPVLCHGSVLWSPPSELVVVLPCKLCYSCHPLLTGIPMFLSLVSICSMFMSPCRPLTFNDMYPRYCIAINMW